MKIAEYRFMDATPLLNCIDKYKSDIIGRPIKAYYAMYSYGCMNDQPIVFQFDHIAIAVFYFFYSDLTLYTFKPEQLTNDPSLSFLFEDDPERASDCYPLAKEDFPFIGCRIADVTVERFSEEFEINAATGETRPEGGDYFKKITVHLEDGRRFYICADDAISDGYIEIWDHF